MMCDIYTLVYYFTRLFIYSFKCKMHIFQTSVELSVFMKRVVNGDVLKMCVVPYF